MLFQRSGLVLLVFAGSIFAATSGDPATSRAKAAMARLPLHFEQNQGQWNSEVLYAARSGSGTLFLTAQGPALAASTGKKARRVDLSLVRGNRAPVIEPLDRLPARTDYFTGGRERWRAGISQYARIAYRSVYPGIDIVYYGNSDQLEYDLLLRPGADPKDIKLRFKGADRVDITPEGDLRVECAGAHFLQKRPVLYQDGARNGERHELAGRYKLVARDTVGVDVSDFDRSRTLVIDPVLNYASFLGGSSTDVINAVTAGADGLIYVAGYTNSTDLQPTFNGVSGANTGGKDAFIAAIDPTRFGGPSLRYLTYLGGSRDDAATAIAVDASSNIYVTGTTNSSDFPLSGNSVQTALALSTSASVFNTDAFVCIISQNNGLVYSTYFGGTGDETPYGLGLDAKGLIYVGGTTTSTDMPVTANAVQAVNWGPSDIFFLKLDVNATTPDYASYLGGEDEDDGRGLAVAPNGLVYFAASTLSTEFPMAGFVYQGSPKGTENLVIGVMDMTQSGASSLVYSTYVGGSAIDEVRQIALDANGKLLVTGWTVSPDFPVTANALRSQYGGSGNAFVLRVNPAAPPATFLEYGTYLGGSGGDVAYAVTSDKAGTIYVAGYTLSLDFPVTPDAIVGQFGYGAEAFLVKLNPSVAGPGALLYGTYLGAGGFHVATGLALAPNGSMFTGGYTTDALEGIGPVLPAAYQPGFDGGFSDGFVATVK
jgi:Beta-propeller repeat